MIVPVVLAGGVGSRLWPKSRAALPKQFMRLPGQKSSLFQQTLERLRGFENISDPVVVCNEDHRFLVAEQLRELGLENSKILLEHIGRNTAPAVAMAAHLVAVTDAAAVLLILPADHIIANVPVFHQALDCGAQLAQQDNLVTFGVVPDGPETGYGYIQTGEEIAYGAHRVAKFVEKPDLATAQAYLAQGDYVWNSGMFMFTAANFLAELSVHAADILDVTIAAFHAMEADADFYRIPRASFDKCRSESIDYAVMEKTGKASVVPLDANWSDLGAWGSLWDVAGKDDQQNVLSGDVLIHDVEHSYIHAESRMVAAVGLRNAVIVETADAVLVSDRENAQAVKQIVEQLQLTNSSMSSFHTLVHRPWGSFESLAKADNYQVKHLIVKPGASLSLQKHSKRAEHWTVIHGVAKVQCGEEFFDLRVNDSTFIPLGSKHRIINESDQPVELIEIQVGSYFGEDDIIRFEDIYGRTNDSND